MFAVFLTSLQVFCTATVINFVVVLMYALYSNSFSERELYDCFIHSFLILVNNLFV